MRFCSIGSNLKGTTEESPREARATENVPSTLLPFSCLFLTSVRKLLASSAVEEGSLWGPSSLLARVYSDFLLAERQASPHPDPPSPPPTARTRTIVILQCLQLYNTTCRFSDKKHAAGTGGSGKYVSPLCWKWRIAFIRVSQVLREESRAENGELDRIQSRCAIFLTLLCQIFRR